MYYDEYLPKIRAALAEAQKQSLRQIILPITAAYNPSQIREAIEHSSVVARFYCGFNHPKQ